VGSPGNCAVCDRLSPTQLLELDTIVGDPAVWPVSVWSIFEPPKGALPASYRRFGAVRMGRDWLDANGYNDIFDGQLRKHIRYDVVHVARDAGELASIGLIRQTRPKTTIPTASTLDTGAFIRYFNAGIQMGEAAARLMAERINAAIEAGDEPDPKLVMKLADMGASFAKTQASLMSKGLKFGQEENEDDAFRGSAETLPSANIGHTRVRLIDGERRPVRDRGPADRERHRRRAEEEGSEGLG
jgi:hypothetical protein